MHPRIRSASRSVAALAALPFPVARALATATPIAGAVLFAAAVALLPVAAGAVVVSGQVTDEQGFGIFNVDLDFFDRNTGMIIFTPGDNTDFGGFYSVDVPVSEYDITFRAPNGSPYLDQEIREDITGPMTIDMVLPVGQMITGLVTDEGGAPLVNIDLNFYDVALRTVINTSLNQVDNTDSTGHFLVMVPKATYDVRFTPPLGQPYAGVEIPGVVVTADMDLGTTVVPAGLFVSGRVLDPAMQAVADTDLDFEDVTTGNVIFTPRDNTAGNGDFSVAVPTGTYDVIVSSPAGSGWAWSTLYDVPVTADLAVGTVVLQPGSTVSGTVLVPGGGPSVVSDLDAIDTSNGQELNMPSDNTDAAGVFGLLVTTGKTIDVAAFPPTGVTAAAGIVRGVGVPGNVNVGTIQLVTGFSVSGTVTSGGLPVAGADLDAFDLSAGGLLYPTGGDKSDPAGNYGIRLPAGSYLIVASPPLGSGDPPDSTTILLSTDTVHDFVLGGGAVDAPLAGTAGAALRLRTFPNPFRSATTIAFDLPAGARDARVSVYDTAGRLVRSLDASTARAGSNRVVWDGRDARDRRVASGVYLYRLEAAGEALTRKVVVLR